MNLDQVLQTFYDESRELLVDMEIILLDLEFHPDDSELKNALFRCVHTIKGSSGMFGFDAIVNFTHVVENILDRLRADDIQYSRELAQLLLKSRDHIQRLIDLGDDETSADMIDEGKSLLENLEIYQQVSEAAPEPTLDQSEPGDQLNSVHDGLWHISLRFDRDIFRHGMDPLGFIRFLQTTGEITALYTLTHDLPDIEQMDAESCYLGFEISLQSSATADEIRAVFEFVEELSRITIIPPGSAFPAYAALLESLSDERDAVAEWLIAQGKISQNQLTRHTDGDGLIESDDVGAGKVVPVVPASETGATAEKTEHARESPAAKTQYIRVEAKKLDQLINLVGELVIASSSVAVNASLGGDKNTRESATSMSLLVDDIRDAALDLRMVPIGESFQRFQRIVRDVSAELDKEIYLSVHGADTELDKSVVEKINDPLTHLVRNACDHGIEGAAWRLSQGKTAQGTIRLNAYHQASHVVIEISDDGNGLDRDRIHAKAIEKNLVTAEQSLSDQEIFNLIFEPGFSTASAVTNLSGRGVGMDVVKRSIQALRGTIEVISKAGEGTTFRLRLPLTLAIIDGFVSAVGNAVYVIPLEAVVECVEFSVAEQLDVADRQFLNLRGEVLPFIRLREYFQVAGTATDKRQNIIVVSHAGKKAGLVVDDLLGEHQTVIKPLGRLFSHLQGFSGSTIMGNGQVALVLDVATLIQQVAFAEEGRYTAKAKQLH